MALKRAWALKLVLIEGLKTHLPFTSHSILGKVCKLSWFLQRWLNYIDSHIHCGHGVTLISLQLPVLTGARGIFYKCLSDHVSSSRESGFSPTSSCLHWLFPALGPISRFFTRMAFSRLSGLCSKSERPLFKPSLKASPRLNHSTHHCLKIFCHFALATCGM